MVELSKSVAIVTGAARGIGKAIALAYARLGIRVAAVDVSTDPLQATAAETAEDGLVVLPIVADITDLVQVETMASQVEADQLSGRYLLVTQDLGELVARANEIAAHDLWTLRIRK